MSSIDDGIISVSIEQPEKTKVDKEETVLADSPSFKPVYRKQTTVNIPITFDVSILLELIESMICDLLSFDKIEILEFLEFLDHSSENDQIIEKLLSHLQQIESLIREHETQENIADIYNQLQITIRALIELMILLYNRHEDVFKRQSQSLTEVRNIADEKTTASSVSTDTDEIFVPSFKDYITSSIHALGQSNYELDLVINKKHEIQMDHKYIYIHPSVTSTLENSQQSPSPRPVTTSGVASDIQDMTHEVTRRNLVGDLDRINKGLANEGESFDLASLVDGGRRPTSKKSTHRKPRRHTRNYQSHNKRKHHSSKKSTIKHHKSYRKHNRTIKRRKSRRHH